MRLLAPSDIGRVLPCEVSTRTVRNWRKHPDFPAPVASYGRTSRPLYCSREVMAWVERYRPEYLQPAGEVQS